MRKIISLFVRNETDHLVSDEITPGAQWVIIAGEGVATRKYNGTACLVRGGRLYRRYELKTGKTPPAQFEPAQEKPDPLTGDLPGMASYNEMPARTTNRNQHDQGNGRCFACDRLLGTKKPHEVFTSDPQMQWVGPDCYRKVVATGMNGYQPPKGGPKLFRERPNR